jgi:hypothetical protein
MNSNIHNKINENLLGTKFRILNEKLYTTSSEEAYQYFTENPEDFDIVNIVNLSIIKASKYKPTNGQLIRIN